MGDVTLTVDGLQSVCPISHCRICHEAELESCLEAPCACSGTVKFTHRDCIQRWCIEKGDTTCEICLQTSCFGKVEQKLKEAPLQRKTSDKQTKSKSRNSQRMNESTSIDNELDDPFLSADQPLQRSKRPKRPAKSVNKNLEPTYTATPLVDSSQSQ